MEFRDKPMENLIRIQEKDICKNARALLLDGEQVVGAYKTVRDQVIFTTHRIIMVDMQGVTGTRQQIFVLPYRKVLHPDGGFRRPDPGFAADGLLCRWPRGKVRLHRSGGIVRRGQCHQPVHFIKETARACRILYGRPFCWIYEGENGIVSGWVCAPAGRTGLSSSGKNAILVCDIRIPHP